MIYETIYLVEERGFTTTGEPFSWNTKAFLEIEKARAYEKKWDALFEKMKLHRETTKIEDYRGIAYFEFWEYSDCAIIHMKIHN